MFRVRVRVRVYLVVFGGGLKEKQAEPELSCMWTGQSLKSEGEGFRSSLEKGMEKCLLLFSHPRRSSDP